MSGVPYTFANATTTIALSNLDANFNTPVTIGNTTVGLGNTVTTLGNVTIAGATLSATNIAGGTANGIVYLNSSNVATANGSAFVFDGSNMGISTAPSTWNSSLRVIEMSNGRNGALFADSGYYGAFGLSENAVWAPSSTSWTYKTTNTAVRYDQNGVAGSGTHAWYVAASGTAGATISWTQAMSLQLATFSTGTFQNVLFIKDSARTVSTFNAVNSTSWNSSVNAAMVLGSADGRSLSAAGTLNASGADYAEYMTKSGNFTINKGDICGVDANGKLTNVFANAISFVVKSTNPSYVGGDNWGNEEVLGVKPVKPTQAEGESDADYQTALTAYETDLTAWNAKALAAQQMVDRIAFSGQVPVNVTGATAGQYIVPVANQDGSIGGQSISESAMTLQQYMQSVGKVISVVGNVTTIIVKVA